MRYNIDLLGDYGNIIDINSLNDSDKSYVQKEIENGAIIEADEYVCGKCGKAVTASLTCLEELFGNIIENNLEPCTECNSDLNKTLVKKQVLKVNVTDKDMKATNKILSAAPELNREIISELLIAAKRSIIYTEVDLKFSDKLNILSKNSMILHNLISSNIITEITEAELYCKTCGESIIIDEYLNDLIIEYKKLMETKSDLYRLDMLYDELGSQSFLLLCDNDCDYGADLEDLIDKHDEDSACTAYKINKDIFK